MFKHHDSQRITSHGRYKHRLQAKTSQAFYPKEQKIIITDSTEQSFTA